MGTRAIRGCAVGCVLAMALANRGAWAAKAPQIDPAQLVALKEIAEGYFHNRESFPFFPANSSSARGRQRRGRR